MTPSISTTWSAPFTLISCARTAVSCVIVKTKTRSKNSSSVETLTSSSSGGVTRLNLATGGEALLALDGPAVLERDLKRDRERALGQVAERQRLRELLAA